MAYTLTELIAQVRARADAENHPLFTDAEITVYLNDSILECWDMLTTIMGDEVGMTTDTITLTAGQNVYGWTFDSGKENFLRLLRMSITIGYQNKPLRRNDDWNNGTVDLTPQTWNIGTDITYRISRSGFVVHPVPATAYTIIVNYIPKPNVLVNGSDEAQIGSFEDYVVVDAAIKCVTKEEGDISALVAQKQMITERMRRSVYPADGGNARRVIDIYDRQTGDPFEMLRRRRW